MSVFKDLFPFSLIFYLILLILETILPGFVSNNFDLNWVLGIVVFLGIIFVFLPSTSVETTADKEGMKITDYLILIFLGIVGGFLIFHQIQQDLTPRLIVAVIGGMLIVLISLTTFRP